MSNRTVKKLRHRTDIADIPSFSERMLAGQNGESMCKNPHCRKFAKTHMPDGKHCQYCYVVPSVDAKSADFLDEVIAEETAKNPDFPLLVAEATERREHAHTSDCKHGSAEHEPPVLESHIALINERLAEVDAGNVQPLSSEEVRSHLLARALPAVEPITDADVEALTAEDSVEI